MPGVNLRPASAESYEETIAVNEPDLSDGHGLMNIISFHGLQAGSGKILPATYCPLISPADETLSRLRVQYQTNIFH